MMSEGAEIAVAIDDGILTIVLDRPDRMNVFTPQMLREMKAAFDRADDDDAVRAIIVTGRGDRAFCAGADLGAGAECAVAPPGYDDRPNRIVIVGAVERGLHFA